jgi:tetratricopeptide (TPR) repeat protein
MLNELEKIIGILEIPNSDPVTERLRRRGLAFYRDDAVMELKAEIEQPSGNGWNETQEFRAVSYLFFACIKSHYGKYEEAIKAASNALETIRLTRGGEFNEGLAHWFRGILYNLANDNRSAIDDFEEAVSILDERAHAFERECNYRKKFYCIKLIRQITSRVPPEWFSEIIGRLIIPEENSLLYQWWVAIRDSEPFELKFIEPNIENLKNILPPETEETSDATPFYTIFLAHCYKLGFYTGEGDVEYQKKALATVKERFDDYISNLDEYNQSLLRLYLALLYYDVSNVENALSHLKEANRLLVRLLERNIDTDTKDIQSLQMEIQDWINKFETEVMYAHDETPESQEIQHPFGLVDTISTFVKRIFDNTSLPEKTSYPLEIPTVQIDKKSFPPVPINEVTDPTLNQTIQSDSSHPLFHITIPVDVQAFNNSRIDSTSLTSSLFKQLQQYSEHFGDGSQSIKTSYSDEMEYIIPSIPIFGQVTAGPKGEPYLDESTLTHAKAVDETLRIGFEGKKYKVNFINNVRVTFVDGKNYGWFKVKGKSMNNATNNPISEGDYVLFCENHDPEACKGKIVVAFLPEINDKLLMIKRLIRLSADSSFSKSGFRSKVKFILQSESLLDKDPETNISYKEDIDIKYDFQLVGEVVAIAKPI